jgi:hypothetical protein
MTEMLGKDDQNGEIAPLCRGTLTVAGRRPLGRGYRGERVTKRSCAGFAGFAGVGGVLFRFDLPHGGVARKFGVSGVHLLPAGHGFAVGREG